MRNAAKPCLAHEPNNAAPTLEALRRTGGGWVFPSSWSKPWAEKAAMLASDGNDDNGNNDSEANTAHLCISVV